MFAYWHLLSLDAPTIAIVWCWMFAWAAGVHLPDALPVALAAAAWVLYAADRLLDSTHAQRWSALRERHWFHARHRKALRPPMIAAGIFALGVTAWITPPRIVLAWALLGLAAGAYFATVHLGALFQRRPLPMPLKELFVGAIFATAVVIPAFTLTRSRVPMLGAWICFAALCSANCLVIELAEIQQKEGRQNSRMVHAALAILASACMTLALCVHAEHAEAVQALLACIGTSALLLLLLSTRRAAMAALTFRIAADACLLTPLLCLPWFWMTGRL